MARFHISAFADEYSASFDEQIEGLLQNGVRMIELRGIDGVSVSDLTQEAASAVRRKLDSCGIGVSAIGSPIGKIALSDSMDAHLEKLRNTCEVANLVGCGRIRMFSFYVPAGNYDETKNEVFDRMGQMLDVADTFGVKLCHENEKGIWGDSPERCRELLDTFVGRLGCVFDPANFIQCGCEPFEHGYNLLKHYLTYMHIKDAVPSGTVVPSGMGAGCVPETLAAIHTAFPGEVILTVEPHLRVFDGLAALEAGHRSVVGSTYATAAEAFAAAIEHLRWCLPRGAEVL